MKNKSEVVNIINSWSENEGYAGAVVFGSFASEVLGSDVDVFIITFEDKLPKPHTSKLKIFDVDFDITFLSISQFISMIKGQIRSHSFKPQLLESIIVFDKTNRIKALKEETEKDASPADKKHLDYSSIRYALNDITEAIEKNIEKDPDTAVLLMHADIEVLIKYYFRLNQKWQVPAKQVLKNLAEWDNEFANKLREFIKESNPQNKFDIWKVLKSKVEDLMSSGNTKLVCDCAVCEQNLGFLKQV